MLNLTPEQFALFSLLRDEEISLSSINWDAVKQEALSQSVFLMISSSHSLPADIAASWSKASYTMVRSNMRELYAVAEVDRIMHSIHQPYVILKGVAAAYYYPNPQLRAFGDVDFLINPEHKSKVEQTFMNAGYNRTEDSEGYDVSFQKKHQELEMHYSLSGAPKGELGELVKEYTKDILKETIPYSIEGISISLPLPKYHGLILLLHMLHHLLEEGIGLRHLIDWCYFVKATEQDEFWNTDLIPFLKSIGLLHFASVMTRTGAMYLCTPCPIWAEPVDDSLCDSVMSDILTSGNFGRKDSTRPEHSKYILDRGNGGVGKKKGLGQAIDAVMVKSKEENRSVPAILIEYAGKILKGERKLDNAEVKKKALERKEIYKQFKLYEVE